MHHGTSYNHNYGFYFTWWDKLMGTEHPDYVQTFDRVTRRDADNPQAAARAVSPA
jgi:Delta7-sterol 5-desaturase